MKHRIILYFYSCGRRRMTSVNYFDDNSGGFFFLKNILWLYVKHGWSIVGFLEDFERAAEEAWKGKPLFLTQECREEVSYVVGDRIVR